MITEQIACFASETRLVGSLDGGHDKAVFEFLSEVMSQIKRPQSTSVACAGDGQKSETCETKDHHCPNGALRHSGANPKRLLATNGSALGTPVVAFQMGLASADIIVASG
ncbi:hypothetical protein [Bradyrhizobium sp. CCBAU 11434]|uniref:hypothetical protein n=1 Tax=Bradyrhizobium sp. CCBAU 11434 TaxID=1630885 RepID=UPI002305D4C7|nr:hypothetical protein [Bradyrhizobium sp. CCBAU 11434]